MTFPCMLAHPFSADSVSSWPVAVEKKFDGVRALFIIEPGCSDVACYSRAGKEFTSVKKLCSFIAQAYEATGSQDGLVLDGELFCGNFNKTVSLIRRKNAEAHGATYQVFDMVPFAEWQSGAPSIMKWLGRRELLTEFVELLPVETFVLSSYVEAHTVEEVLALSRQAMVDGHEGVIVKDRLAAWHPGRSHGWMKIKDEKSEDLKVVGIFEGEGKYVGTTGGITVDFNGVIVNVGTGLTDAERHEIWASHLLGEVVGRTAEITYQEITPYGSMRHPAFKGFRIDK